MEYEIFYYTRASGRYNEPSMLTEKVDVYSFGVVMFVVVTCQPAIVQGEQHTSRSG